MVHWYETDYGRVRISEHEAQLLKLGAPPNRDIVAKNYPDVLAKAESVKAACERVARFKLNHG